jgi:hypothetical protein
LPEFVEARRQGSTGNNVEDAVLLEDVIKEDRSFVCGFKGNHGCACTIEISKAVAMAVFYVTG